MTYVTSLGVSSARSATGLFLVDYHSIFYLLVLITTVVTFVTVIIERIWPDIKRLSV